jgi:short subunit dehydrogenase-like uncharacterized protein
MDAIRVFFVAFIMSSNKFLLYGANGYTGQLTARIARQYNLQPILAGRNESAIRPIAEQLQLPFRIFSLDDKNKLQQALKETAVVLHTAGPFQNTSRQMIEACLETGTHYLDINGNIDVFEFIKTYDQKAKAAAIMLMPGVGFDVVPTDCMALLLKNKLPDAVKLQLAFASIGGSVSHGTAMTMSGRLGEKGAVRENGKIVEKPLGHKGMWVDFGEKKLFVMTIPWGDIATAYHTTGIPNIESYTGIKPTVYRLLKFQGLFNWLLRTEWMRNIVRKKINQRPAGPSDEMREKAKAFVWGKVWNNKRETAEARMSGPEGYTLTAHSSLIITKKILNGEFSTGFQTPAGCYGQDLVLEIPEVKREIL